MTWRTVLVGELGAIVTGRTPPSKHPERFGAVGEYPFFTPTDLGEHSRTPTPARFISALGRGSMEQALLPAGATGFVCIGATIGKMVFTTEPSFTNQQLNAVIPDTRRHDARFVFYALKTAVARVQAEATGAATPIVNKRKFSAVSLRVPALPVQRRVADILSAYDELIEINNRRMLALEESIHLLFRAWFVALRFPGRERVSVVDGVPQGWARAPSSRAIAYNPKTPIPRDQPRPYVPMRSLSTSSMRIRGVEARAPKGGARFRNGDTLLARISPCLENGKTGFVQFMASPNEVASGSTEFIVLRGMSVPASWVYCLARSPSFRREAINRMSGTDGRQRVDWRALAELEILVPPQSLAGEFAAVADGVFRQVHSLNKHNDTLREARDLLLPRLMDGRISV